MARIGGNTTASIDRCTKYEKNEAGESVPVWKHVGDLIGWLDLQNDSGGQGPNYSTFQAAIAESSHVFVADYDAIIAGVKYDTCRATINGQRYDVKLIDDPMELHKQLEIYLKHTGGQ